MLLIEAEILPFQFQVAWQVTLCDPVWHVSSRSGVATLRTVCVTLVTYLLTYFNHRVTVYPVDDYDRKSPRMYIARRRQQLTLRIQQMELILAPILDNVHRLKIRMSRCDT